MPRPKPTDEDLRDRGRRALEWIDFRKTYLFTQVRLAEVLQISRRGVQLVEKGKVTPLTSTLSRFQALKARHQAGRAA